MGRGISGLPGIPVSDRWSALHNKFFKHLSLLLVFLPGLLTAAETPSWAVINAADKFLGDYVLLRPGRDAYSLKADGRMVQFQLPKKNYVREGSAWTVEFSTNRWRETQGEKNWQRWNETGSPSTAHLISSVRVEVLSSGVKASWAIRSELIGTSAPTEAEVSLRSGGASQVSPSPAPPARDIIVNEFGSMPAAEPAPERRAPSPNAGIYRKKADGSVQKIDALGNAVKPLAPVAAKETPEPVVAPAEPPRRWVDVLVTRAIVVVAGMVVMIAVIGAFLPKRGSRSRTAARG